MWHALNAWMCQRPCPANPSPPLRAPARLRMSHPSPLSAPCPPPRCAAIGEELPFILSQAPCSRLVRLLPYQSHSTFPWRFLSPPTLCDGCGYARVKARLWRLPTPSRKYCSIVTHSPKVAAAAVCAIAAATAAAVASRFGGEPFDGLSVVVRCRRARKVTSSFRSVHSRLRPISRLLVSELARRCTPYFVATLLVVLLLRVLLSAKSDVSWWYGVMA